MEGFINRSKLNNSLAASPTPTNSLAEIHTSRNPSLAKQRQKQATAARTDEPDRIRTRTSPDWEERSYRRASSASRTRNSSWILRLAGATGVSVGAIREEIAPSENSIGSVVGSWLLRDAGGVMIGSPSFLSPPLRVSCHRKLLEFF